MTDKMAAMVKARDFVDNRKSQSGYNEEPHSSDRNVWVHATLLSGDWKSVWNKAENMPPLGWSSSSYEQGMAVISALVWIHGYSHPLPPQMELLWKKQLCSGSHRFRSFDEDRSQALENAYRAMFEANPWTKMDMTARLNQCEGVVHRRVSAIVSNTYREAYKLAALLTVACAETFKAHGKVADGDRLIMEIRKAFPRHSSFQSEIKNALTMKKGT